jgi:hypothetical protein
VIWGRKRCRPFDRRGWSVAFILPSLYWLLILVTSLRSGRDNESGILSSKPLCASCSCSCSCSGSREKHDPLISIADASSFRTMGISVVHQNAVDGIKRTWFSPGLLPTLNLSDARPLSSASSLSSLLGLSSRLDSVSVKFRSAEKRLCKEL